MSVQPTPPTLPQDVKSFADHIHENVHEWFLYYQQAYNHLEVQRLQINKLSQTIDAQDEKIAAQYDKINTLETKTMELTVTEKTLLALLDKKDSQILEATLSARLAQQASLPTMRVLTPDTSRDPAEGPPAPYLGTTPPPATESAASARLSERLPDPDKFDGNRSDLRRFSQQVYAKMTSNADRFLTPTSRLTYVAGRLTGRAYNLIIPRTTYGIPQFADYPELLAYLESAFGDPDRVQNAQNRLYQLKQKNQDFSAYLTEFQRLALEGELHDEALTPLLFQGISRELQDMLLHSPAPTRNFREYANHLQTLDNRFRQHQQQVNRGRAVPSSSGPKRMKTPSPTRGRSPTGPATAPGDPMDLSNQRQPRGPNRKANHLCYRCGSDSHYVRDCPKPDTRNTQVRSAALPAPCSPTLTNLSPVPSSRRSSTPPTHSENGASLS
jgi:hypothetical protein